LWTRLLLDRLSLLASSLLLGLRLRPGLGVLLLGGFGLLLDSRRLLDRPGLLGLCLCLLLGFGHRLGGLRAGLLLLGRLAGLVLRLRGLGPLSAGGVLLAALLLTRWLLA